MDFMFKNCSSLSYLNLSSFKGSLLKNTMNYMFLGCINLTSIDFHNLDISNTFFVRNIFKGCYNLQYLNLSNSKADNSDLSYMFNNMKKIISIDLSNFRGSSINTTMEYMFNNCKNLIELDLSKFIFTPLNMDHMFNGCSSLKYLNLSRLNYSYNRLLLNII